MPPFKVALIIKILALVSVLLPLETFADIIEGKPTLFITGSNHGIGLEFVNQYSKKGWNVIATCRSPDKADALNAMAAQRNNITIEQLDVTDHPRIEDLAEKYKEQPIDILMNNAALTPKYKSAFKRLKGVDFDIALKSFEVNAIAPLKISKEFMSHVAASTHKKMIVISSKGGSIAESPKMPMMYSYRASKAALNMYMYTLSFETTKKDIILTMLSPGMVDTMDGQGMKMPKAMTPAESVSRMVGIIDNLSPGNNGKFLSQKDGAELRL